MSELHDIVTKVDRNTALFVEHLRNLHKLNEIANSKLLDIDEAKCVLQILRTNYYMLLHEYYLSETLKMHSICVYYEDYFELTGETLLKVTDKVTESVHARYRLFEERHGYVCTKKGNITYFIKQHKSVIHYNSLNLCNI